ncbi:glycosyltransferase [Parvularcula sp. ZS-1/3]|uniref:Glycosyltransferase n=1 Tax=Parvularcula mediterranea TaxID=2732508 RepID=A0A7Y3RMC9_9PROT|nr:glycosyltransferase [Parvularcula mediterranea]NNU16645.1 glycosyltransferase [Parvularcula mediterranea]
MTGPEFSIIIPTYGRPEQIAACVESLRGLEGPSFEVVVVDDGSPEPVMIDPALYADDFALRVIRQENAGPGAARNRGANEAHGRYLAFTDDDCRPCPDWLERYLAVLDGHPERLAGGLVVNGLERNVFAAASQDIITFLYKKDGADLAFFTSNNFACAREAFLDCGGFDPALRTASEDRDFCIRWRARGGETVQAECAIVEHFHDLRMESFWRQHTNYGRGARDLSDKLERTGDAEPLRVRGFGFYRDLVSWPYAAGGSGKLARSLLIVLSHVAMARGFYLRRR